MVVVLSGCITSFSPKGGPVAGGTTVTITGTHFLGATAVKFGTTAATRFTVTGASTITAVTKAHTPGTVNISVSTPTGVFSRGGFTFEVPPTLSGISPANGWNLGGTSVTLTGTNLTGTTAVKFGTTGASSFTVTSPTKVTAVTAPHPVGTVAVDLASYGGSATASSDYKFTNSAAPPTITASSTSFANNARQLSTGSVADAIGTTVFTQSSWWANRFPAVGIPKGAIIHSAKWSIHLGVTAGQKIGATVWGEKAANPGTFTGHTGVTAYISTMTKTTHSVGWDGTSLTPSAYNTSPTLKTVIQELITQPTWVAGNAMMLFMEGVVASKTMHLYGNDHTTGATPPQLTVAYSLGTTIDMSLLAPNDSASQQNETHTVVLGTATATLIYTKFATNYGYLAMRFGDTTIPKGSTINAARLHVVHRGGSPQGLRVKMRALNTANPAVFTTTAGSVSSRSMTGTLAWGEPTYTYGVSPTLKALVQAIVTLPGWASGNALGLVMVGTTTPSRFVNYGPTGPVLDITYSPPLA